LATFQFHGFKLETARPTNYYWKLAREWTEADPAHRNATSAGFWFEHGMGVESYTLEDDLGVVFFFKMVRWQNAEVELHIQFPPPELSPRHRARQRDRIMKALTLGLEWIEKVVALKEATRLFFVSNNPALIYFCVHRLGFIRENKRLVKLVVPIRGIASSAANGK
jgi:hypothetical protein